MIRVRPATRDDAEHLVPLIRELGYEQPAEVVAGKLAAAARSEVDAVLLAVDDDRIAGLIACHALETLHIAGRLGRITALVVAASHQRRGVGAMLVDAAETFFRSAGCRRIEVTSGVRREGAHAFYRAQGYAETSKRFVKSV